MKENNDRESKLKLIHLVWLILGMAATVGVGPLSASWIKKPSKCT
jgi:hypothetical protein